MARRKPAKAPRPAPRGRRPDDVDARAVTVNEIIADFMKASSRLERFLYEKGELTALQQQSIETTIDALRTFWQTWRTHLLLKSNTPSPPF
jgi:hypothetical protein